MPHRFEVEHKEKKYRESWIYRLSGRYSLSPWVSVICSDYSRFLYARTERRVALNPYAADASDIIFEPLNYQRSDFIFNTYESMPMLILAGIA